MVVKSYIAQAPNVKVRITTKKMWFNFFHRTRQVQKEYVCRVEGEFPTEPVTWSGNRIKRIFIVTGQGTLTEVEGSVQ